MCLWKCCAAQSWKKGNYIGMYISSLSFMFHHSFDQIIILTSIDSRLQSVPDYLVRHYKNIVLARLDFAKLVYNTPLSKIFWESSLTRFFLNNISDIIRVVLLWQFGGTYLDSDVISLKPVPPQVRPFWHSLNIIVRVGPRLQAMPGRWNKPEQAQNYFNLGSTSFCPLRK